MKLDHRALEAAAALKALSADRQLPRADLPYAQVLRRPAEYLGALTALPPALRAALVQFFCDEDEIRTLGRGVLSAGLALAGSWVSRPLYRLERLVGKVEARTAGRWRQRAGRLRIFLRSRARQAGRAPYLLRGRLQAFGARLAVRRGSRDLAMVLRAQRVDARALGFNYLEGVPQLPRCEAVAHRPDLPATFAFFVGLDFVKSEGRYWFLEANWNPSLMDQRLSLYDAGQDPWVNRLLACTLARGYRRLVIYGYRPFPPGHGTALIEAGQRAGVEVVVVDDFFSSRYPTHRRALFMERDLTRGAFVVRAKACDVLFDRALTLKRHTREIVEPARVQWEAAGVALPRLIGPGSTAPHYRGDARYPNIVAKEDGLDRGAGVSFYKLPQAPVGLDHIDFFEEYRIPDPCLTKLVRGQSTPITGAERTWKLRSFALLTPEGVEYLSSIKVVSGLTVPDRLADGEVRQKKIFVVTINEGGFYSAVTAAEDEEYAVPTKAICEVLLSWLRRKHSDVYGAVDREAVADAGGARRAGGGQV